MSNTSWVVRLGGMKPINTWAKRRVGKGSKVHVGTSSRTLCGASGGGWRRDAKVMTITDEPISCDTCKSYVADYLSALRRIMRVRASVTLPRHLPLRDSNLQEIREGIDQLEVLVKEAETAWALEILGRSNGRTHTP